MSNPSIEYNPQYRPRRVQKVTHLPQAEKWRQTILGEISTALTRLNDPSTTESSLRSFNDNLNRLYKEKRAWEHHIRKLGGPDYISHGGAVPIASLVSVDGYRYFGRARDLPDVKQFLAKQQAKKTLTHNNSNLASTVDSSGFGGIYYGQDYISPVALSANTLLTAYGYPALNEGLVDDEIYAYECQRSKELFRENADVTSKTLLQTLPDPALLPSEKDIEVFLVEQRRKQLMTRLSLEQ